jgi:hypothetical protein
VTPWGRGGALAQEGDVTLEPEKNFIEEYLAAEESVAELCWRG